MRGKNWILPGGALACAALLSALAYTHARQAAPAAPADPTKKKIELRPKAVLARSAAVKPGDNPKVAPGKVRWHASAEAAGKAAAKSGKPVLLFNLMGRLDHTFC
jgi:hypothetical protein